MKSQSPETPTLADHQKIRQKYVNLAWQLWTSQQRQGFFVWHPLPEEHLRIEVVMFWEGQISHLAGWNDVVGQVVDAVVEPIKSFFTWVWENLIRPGIEVIVGGVKWVVDGILAVVGEIQKGVAGLGAKLVEGVSWIYKQFEGFFSAIAEVLKQIGTWIINAVKTHVVDPILGFLKAAFDVLKQIIEGIWNFITGGGLPSSSPAWRGSTTRWLGILSGVAALTIAGVVGLTLIDAIHPFKDTKAADVLKFVIGFSGMAFLQAAFFTTYFDIAAAKPIRQELNALFRPEVPSIGDATRMLWRGKIDDKLFDDVIAVHGFGDPWSDGYKALTENLPGSGDLILFVVREVIAPAEFTQAMAWQGFSKYWADAYWEAHWLLPPPERTRTAFLRKQIPEAEYRKFLVWYDFKPDPRPGISLSDVDIMLGTQYDWPGRIDMRWMVEWGVVPMEGLVEMLKADGMDPAWAPRVAEAWLLNQLREELSKVRGVYEKALREGFLNPVAFAEKLTGIHYAPHVINTLRKWADEELALAERLELADEYEKLAKDEIITPEEYGQALRELRMVEERITRKVNYVKRILAIKAIKEAAKKKAAAET